MIQPSMQHVTACKLSGDSGLVKFLLEGGANPNLQNEEGNTPLHIIDCICKKWNSV